MQFGRSLTVRGAAPSFDAATLAWVAAVFAVDSTVVSTPRKTLVDNLIVGLKADGIWTKLDRLWLFAMENSTEALVDIVAASLATAVNSPIFTPDNGYTGDVNTFRYINTNWNPATEGVSYTLNSASMTVWSNTSRAVASGRFVLGADKAGDQALVSFFSTSGLTSIRLNTVAGGGAIASPTSLGLFTANRSLASAQQWYQDGASIGTNALSSGTVPSDDIFLLVLNSSGSPGSPDDIQISCAAFGGSLDATNNANLYSRLLTYMNAVGIQTSGFDTDTSAWVAAVVANGGSVSYARMALVDALITGLKDDGVWTKLDRLWLFAAENEFAAEVDLVADAVATPNVSPTFTPDEGYAGNGSTSYVDSGYNPTTNGTNFTLNSAHMSAWVTDAAYSGAGATTGVVGGGTAYSRLIPKFGTSTLVEVNEGGDEVESTRIADGVPHLLASRTASNSVTLYYDGAVSAHSPFANASGALPSYNFYICATNSLGSVIDPTDRNIAMVSYGGALNATEAANLYSRLRTYMTAVGVP